MTGNAQQARPAHRDITSVIVTGGAGFIGANFVHRTLEQRPQVHVHVLDAMSYAANPANLDIAEPELAARLTVTIGSINDAALVDSILQTEIARVGAAHVALVHFAAESHNDNSLLDPGRFAHTNVDGTVVLAEAAVKHGIYMHHISTDEVFGDLALDDPTRFTPTTPYNPSSPYSASKAAADHFIRAFIRSLGLQATISNCSNNYGPRQHPEKFIPRQITALIEGEQPRLYGTGDNVRDWIHVDDHNDAVWAILERGTLGETYLIGADGERSNINVIRDLLAHWGLPENHFIHVTDRPGHDRRYAIDPTSIRTLGWEPQYTNFQEGLAHTIDWYKTHPEWWQTSRHQAEERYKQTERRL